MNSIKELFWSTQLPVKNGIAPIEQFLSDIITSFGKKILESIKNKDEFNSQFYTDINSVVEKFFNPQNKIILAVKQYNEGMFCESEKVFSDYMEEVESKFLLYAFEDNRPQNFFRMREDENGEIKERKEMFHIPRKYRYKIRNERFSVAGLPCLYMSTIENLCWVELGLPNKYAYTQLYFTETAKDWSLLLLQAPTTFALNQLNANLLNDKNKISKLTLDYIKQLPLIFACSIVKANKNANFNEEYIVPHLLMNWIVKNRKSNNIVGVCYKSASPYVANLQLNGDNLAIPIFQYGNDGFCQILKKVVKLTKPIRVDIEEYCEKLKENEFKNFVEMFEKHMETLLSIHHFVNDIISNLDYFSNHFGKTSNEADFNLLISIKVSLNLLKKSKASINEEFLKSIDNLLACIENIFYDTILPNRYQQEQSVYEFIVD